MLLSKPKYLNLKQIIFFASIILGVLIFWHSPSAHAACSPPLDGSNQPLYGSVTSTVNVPSSTQPFRIWSRIMTGTNSTYDSYDLEIDGTCYLVGNSGSITAGSWQWIDYKDGNVNTPIDVNLSAGNHTFIMYGTEDGVKLDRIVLTTDTSCIPSGTGDNCASPSPPSISMTAPAANALVSGNSVPVSATVTETSSLVSQAQLVVDGSPVGTPVNNPSSYNFTWDTTGLNGSHTVAVQVTDGNGVTVGPAVTVNVDNTKPTVNLTSPANNATITSGSTTLSSTFSDANGIGSIQYSYSGANGSGTIASFGPSPAPTSPNSTTWNTSGIANGTYTVTVKATDNANNTQTSNTTITVNNTITPPPDTTPPVVTNCSPANGATGLKGTVTVSCAVTDNVGVDSVNLYIDGILLRTDIAPPYSFSWDTTQGFSDGSHTLKITAYDTSNNPTTVTETVSVTNATAKLGDVNGDGSVNYSDALVIALHWGKTCTPGNTAYGDLDNNGIVNYNDALKVALGWGK